MQSVAFTRYRLLAEIDKVPPDAGGLYMFSLRFPTNYELGIYADRDWFVSDVVQLLKARLNMFHKVLSSANFDGEIADGRAHHIRRSLSVYAKDVSPSIVSHVIERELASSLDRNVLLEILTILRTTIDHAGPLYIGLACEQSLGERLEQHISGQTAVKSGMDRFGLCWDDLFFSCMPLKHVHPPSYRSCEKLMQNILKPAFSNS